MRKSTYLAILLILFLAGDGALYFHLLGKNGQQQQYLSMVRTVVGELGLSDLAVTTEARYTRHPAVSDKVVPHMDYPGNIEHFPSGTFFAPQRGDDGS